MAIESWGVVLLCEKMLDTIKNLAVNNTSRAALAALFLSTTSPSIAQADFPKGLENMCTERDSRKVARKNGTWKEYNQRRYEPVCTIQIGEINDDLTFEEREHLMSEGQRFICKKRHPVLYRLTQLIEGCDGDKRTLKVEKIDGVCAFSAAETGQKIIVSKIEMQKMKNYLQRKYKEAGFLDLITLKLALGAGIQGEMIKQLKALDCIQLDF